MLAQRALVAAVAIAALSACGGPLPSAPEPARPAGEPAESSGAIAFAAPHFAFGPASPPGADDERSEADRAKDAARHPAELLAFFGIGLGQRIGEIGAGTGYTAELLARAVGPAGAVYGQNPRWLLEKSAEAPWAARLRKPAMKNVTRLDREFDDPFPADLQGLDAVVSVLCYHDLVWLGADRGRMNQAVFRALRRGGVYGVVDHAALPNSGARDVRSLHRVDEDFVRTEVLHAGFTLAGESQVLRVPTDTRDWNDGATEAEDEGRSDRFVLKFQKP